MARNGRLHTEITADPSNFNRGIKQAQNSAETFAKKTTASISGVGRALSAVFSGGFVLGLKNAAEELDNLSATASKLDIKPQGLQFLQYAAKRADVEVGVLNSGLLKLRKSIGDAEQGNKKAAAAFKELGLNASELSKLGLDEAYSKIASKLSEVKDSTQQAALVTAIFGRSGQEQLNLLRANVAELKSEFDGLDIAVSDGDLETFGKLDQQLDQLSFKIKGTLAQALVLLAPPITVFADAIQGAISLLVTLSRKFSEFVNGVKSAESSGTSLATEAGTFEAQAEIANTNTFNASTIRELKARRQSLIDQATGGNATINKETINAVNQTLGKQEITVNIKADSGFKADVATSREVVASVNKIFRDSIAREASSTGL